MPSADPLEVYDGFSATPRGVLGADHPLDTPEGALFRLINGTVRSGRPATRPGFTTRPITFPTNRYAELFATGRFQGAMGFDDESGPRIVFAIGGHVFLLDVSSMAALAITDTAGRMDPDAPRLFFLYTGRYLVVQDGSSRPVIWDGSSARRSRFEDQEIPVGTFMAYGHGRIFVTIPGTASFLAGDFELPEDPATALRFTETEYIYEGGAFSLPMALGPITGMAFLRAPATSSSTGLLVVSGTSGISYFNVAYPRSAWGTVSISSVGVLGHGAASHDAMVNIEDDLLYVSGDGDIRTVKTSQAASQTQIHRSYSREVGHWLRDNTTHLLPFASAMLHNRRVYCTVAAEWTTSRQGEELVTEVRHKGMIVLDYDRNGSLDGTDRPAYDGLWTGVRPLAFASARSLNRGFVFSRDTDNRTRLYEIVEDALDDGDRRPEMQVQAQSFVFQGKDRKLLFSTKQFRSVEAWVERIVGRTSLSYAISADSGPWSFGAPLVLAPARLESAAPKNHGPGSWAKRTLPTPAKDGCHPGDRSNPLFGYRFDLRIFLEGRGELNLFRVRGAQEVTETVTQAECCEVEADFDLAPIDDYRYDIRKANK